MGVALLGAFNTWWLLGYKGELMYEHLYNRDMLSTINGSMSYTIDMLQACCMLYESYYDMTCYVLDATCMQYAFVCSKPHNRYFSIQESGLPLNFATYAMFNTRNGSWQLCSVVVMQ